MSGYNPSPNSSNRFFLEKIERNIVSELIKLFEKIKEIEKHNELTLTKIKEIEEFITKKHQ